jgi:plasmid stability protein
VRVAQFVVRHLEDDIAEKLKRRAKRNARSMEDEVRHILRNAVQEGPRPVGKLGSRIAQRFRRVGITTDLPEWRGRAARAADFES